jgi:hypothetical protein
LLDNAEVGNYVLDTKRTAMENTTSSNRQLAAETKPIIFSKVKFTLGQQEIHHKRIVKNIFDWVSAIGGVMNIFLVVAAVSIGGYSQFSQQMDILESFYVLEGQEKKAS